MWPPHPSMGGRALLQAPPPLLGASPPPCSPAVNLSILFFCSLPGSPLKHRLHSAGTVPVCHGLLHPPPGSGKERTGSRPSEGRGGTCFPGSWLGLWGEGQCRACAPPASLGFPRINKLVCRAPLTSKVPREPGCRPGGGRRAALTRPLSVFERRRQEGEFRLQSLQVSRQMDWH